VSDEDRDNDAVSAGDDTAEFDVMMRRIRGHKAWWIILPHSTVRYAWEVAITLTLLYVALVIPVLVFFAVDDSVPGWFAANMVVFGLFVVDMVVAFVSAYEDSQSGDIVVDQRAIAVRYLTTWFLLDLCATIPVELIFPSTKAGNVNQLPRVIRLSRAVRVVRLLRLLRLIRLTRFQRAFHALEATCSLAPSTGRLITTLAWALLFFHWFAGVWFFTGLLVSLDGQESWIDVAGILHEPLGQQYIHSFYWSITYVREKGGRMCVMFEFQGR
jgi:hypothetical protein